MQWRRLILQSEQHGDAALAARIDRLEAFRTAVSAISSSGAACDAGPYDPLEATAGWLDDGEFSTDGSAYVGVEAIRAFFAGLTAGFTLHLFTNFELEDGDETVVRCYGLEAPSLHDVAHFGGFTHRVIHRQQDEVAGFVRWQQGIHLITPALKGWVRGPKIADQTA